MITEFNWMQVIFWCAAGLTLIPSGIAIKQSDLKKVIMYGLVAQSGVFLLLLTLGIAWPAFIYLVLMLLLDVLMLYGNQIIPSQDPPETTRSKLVLIAEAGMSAVFFILIVAAFYLIVPKEFSTIGDSGISLKPVVFDISLLLILFGIFLVIIFSAVGYFLKRK